MDAGADGGIDDVVGGGIAEAGDVFANGAGKQTDVLRQIADMTTEFDGVPVIVVEPAEAQAPCTMMLRPPRPTTTASSDS